MSLVIIGMDPHRRSATAGGMAGEETVLGGGRYGTGAGGYRAMLAAARQWPERMWAIEGCQGIGRHIANRLVADGEQVVDVPAKLPARTRVFATGQGRKTDATGAHPVALAAARMKGLRPVVDDRQLAALRILADRRRSLGDDHTRMVCQLHQLLPFRVLERPRRPAMRCLKRRLSDIVYHQMILDARRLAAGPGGHSGAATGSSAAGSHPSAGTSEKSLPGPATSDSTPAAASPPIHPTRRSRRTPSAPARSRPQAHST